MFPTAVSDEVPLPGTAPAGFEEFYGRHVDALLGFFSRRTRDAELAADLTAETFAAALSAPRRFRPAPHAPARAGGRPDGGDVRGRALGPPPLPPRSRRRDRLAVRHRDQEARGRPAA